MAATMPMPVFCIFTVIFPYFHALAYMRKDIFSTKTPYHWVYNLEQSNLVDEYIDIHYGDKSCTAVHASAILRHGARFPGEKDIRKMTILQQRLKDEIINEKYAFIKSWTNPFTESSEKLLTDLGEEEQYLIGGRFGNRLASLLDKDLNSLRFIVSSKQRTQASALSFYEGLTESVKGEADDSLDPEIIDETLRFHTSCKKFIVDVEQNKTALLEHQKFKQGAHITDLVQKVGQRLGLSHSKITAGDVRLMYLYCAFELALFNKPDWCELFEEEDMRVMEYLSDLKQYWKKAYGHKITGLMSCPLVRDIFTLIDKAIKGYQNDKRYKVGSFQFAHAETVAPLYAALGLFNDSTPLLASNYLEQKDRKFKSSRMMPFSTNILFVLYYCYEADNPVEVKDGSNYVLGLFVNEKAETIPACGEHICPYTQVRQQYKHLIDDCHFEDICSVESQEKHDEL